MCFRIFWRRSLLEKGCFIFIRTSKIFHLLRVFECVNYTFIIIFKILIRFIFCKVNTIAKIIILDYTITLFDLSKEERVCLKSLRCLDSNLHVTSLWSYFIFWSRSLFIRIQFTLIRPWELPKRKKINSLLINAAFIFKLDHPTICKVTRFWLNFWNII